MNASENLDQVKEQIRLSYAHLINVHIRHCYRYNQFKNKVKSEKLKKGFQQINRYFFDESGKINWETILPLMPPEIEEKIKKEYNMLNENEIRLCCLHLFSVPGSDIADILPYAHTSIHSTTYRIKRKVGTKNLIEKFKDMLL